jgi:hypothetical protein
MKKTLLYQICLLLIVINTKAQTFQKTFGTPGDDYSSDIIQTSDKGYAVLGTLNRSGVYLLKIDSLGNKQWSKNLALESIWGSVLRGFTQTTDGGFILGGSIKYGSSGNYYSFVVKTDNTGNVIWTNMHVALSKIISIKQTIEGDYIAVGMQYSGSRNTLVRFNTSGNITWSRTLPLYSMSTMDVIQLAEDSSFVTCYHDNNPSLNIIMSRFSKKANLMWSKTITNPHYVPSIVFGHLHENGNDVQVTLNGNSCSELLSVNKNGTSAKILGLNCDFYNFSISDAFPNTHKGSFMVGQYNVANAGYGATDILLISIDSLGAFNWAKQIGGASYDIPKSIKQTKDKGVIIVGETESFSSGYNDIYIIKTDSLGQSGCHTTPITFTTSSLIANVANYTGAIDSLFNNITSSQTIAISNPVEVTYNACICVPPVASFTPSTYGDMQDNSTWADKWYWTCSGIPGVVDSTTINKSYYGPLPNGTYTVCLKVKNSCGVDSLCQLFNYVYYPINVKENTENLISNLYPNPFHDKLIITRENPNLNMPDMKIRITNSFGSLIYSGTLEGTEKEIQLPELASGLYFIQFISNGIVVSRKLVKE